MKAFFRNLKFKKPNRLQWLRKKGNIIICLEILTILILCITFLWNKKLDNQSIEVAVNPTTDKKYIKWVEFNATYDALDKAYHYDIDTHNKEVELHFVELLSYLGTKYGGDFKKYKAKDMDQLAGKLLSGKETIESLTKDMKYYSYYYEAYDAVLGGLIGEYEIEVYDPSKQNNGTTSSKASVTGSPTSTPLSTLKSTPSGSPTSTPLSSPTSTPTGTPMETPSPTVAPTKVWEKRYGLKGFSPIAKNYYYYDYDDFGASRSYGYKRVHLGHDMMGQVGSPIIAVESGYIEALGWNQYGGWRIGIRSFDGKRYYYYAHMRKNFPYNKELKVGSIVSAGDVIGYLGRTGYSTTENTNNITTSHLHFGLQLIFDESQKEGNNEIWVDTYALTKFLYRNRSETYKDLETKEYHRIFSMKDPSVEQYKNTLNKHDLKESDPYENSEEKDMPKEKDIANDGVIKEYN
ncbi:MAG TPA: peptidase [Lachnoclostridium phytofermentans]|uniref:Peptidase n=1 Tax=Lachnoclostridium phytofermentans TaxID=66219 RepID=A0A3D2XAA4_9FIRM|nr:peptidoglycan DD-metalloendopeptidase family protein [Lachnoclostridium sp.]HCL03455.1 peptidase [Lachnoclostridium phytofermentans]